LTFNKNTKSRRNNSKTVTSLLAWRRFALEPRQHNDAQSDINPPVFTWNTNTSIRTSFL